MQEVEVKLNVLSKKDPDLPQKQSNWDASVTSAKWDGLDYSLMVRTWHAPFLEIRKKQAVERSGNCKSFQFEDLAAST